MQRLTAKHLQYPLHGTTGTLGHAEAAAIERVTYQRIVDVRHMDTNLMRAPGFQLEPDMSVGTKLLQYAVMGDRFLADTDHSHLLTVFGVAPHRLIDAATTGHYAVDHGLVFPPHAALLQLSHDIGLGGDGFGHDHEAGGVLVEPVHDTGTGHLSNIGAVVQQGIHQRAAVMPCCRMYHQPGRLVDHHDRIIFIDDIQRDRLTGVVVDALQLGFYLDPLATVELVTGPEHLAVNGQSPLLDPALQARTGVIGEQLRDRLIQSHSEHFGRYLCF